MVVGGLYRESQEYLQTYHADGSGEQSLGGEEGPGPQAHRMNQNPEEEKKNCQRSCDIWKYSIKHQFFLLFKVNFTSSTYNHFFLYSSNKAKFLPTITQYGIIGITIPWGLYQQL